MKKEFGKWLLDIAKYIVTAVILSSIFSDLNDKLIVYIISASAVVVSMTFGLLLLKDEKPKKKKSKKI